MQAEIQSTNYIPGDPLNLQCFVQFTDNNGNTFVQSYVYPVGGDPTDQINADLANYNLAQTAVTTSVDDLQAAITDFPDISLSQTLTADPIQESRLNVQE